MQKEKRLLRTKKLFSLPMSILSGYRRFTRYLTNLFWRKENPNLETKHRRRSTSGFIKETIVGIWRSIYESSTVDAILQRTSRGQKTTGGSKGNKANKTGSFGDEAERSRIIDEMAKTFETKGFQYFIEEIEKREELDLSELVEPTLKSENISHNDYVFLLRGRLETYGEIRNIIKNTLLERNTKKIKENSF